MYRNLELSTLNACAPVTTTPSATGLDVTVVLAPRMVMSWKDTSSWLTENRDVPVKPAAMVIVLAPGPAPLTVIELVIEIGTLELTR